ncbi:L-threonine ammonia-lyase-like [Aphomia sociella]
MNDDVEFDEYCDPSNPRKIKYDDILAASRRIAGAVTRTPCTKAHMSERLGMEIYLKQEFMQYTGSFKERGVRSTLTMLSDDQKKYGVITATTGNHGIAMSYHATQMGIPCVIVAPIYAPLNKITKCEQMGAKLILHGANIAESKLYAMTIRKDKKMTYINGYDHPNIIEGQGSIGIEIIEQVPNVDAIIVPCGGGSLLCGIALAAKHLKPDTEIYVRVETDKTCSMVESLRKNERTKLDIPSSIADGIAVPLVGVNTFHNIKGVVDKMIVVKEDWVARAIMHLVEEERFVVEGAGAVTIAAIMAGLFPNLKGKNVVCIISGGNIDTTILARALERGMAAEGRLVKFKVTVSDRPGGMAEMCALLAGIGVTLRDCVPERAWVKGDVFSVEMKVIVETRGWEHAKELIELVKKNYKEYFFQDMNDHAEKSVASRRGPCLAPNPVCMQK